MNDNHNFDCPECGARLSVHGTETTEPISIGIGESLTSEWYLSGDIQDDYYEVAANDG